MNSKKRMARTKQTARKPTGGTVPKSTIHKQGISQKKQPVAASSASEPPPSMPTNPKPIKPFRQPAGTRVNGELVFLWC